jgi:ribosomal protein S18
MHSLGCGFFCRLYWRLALCRGFRKLFWSRRGAWRGRRLTLNPFWSRLSVEFLCIALPQNFSIMSEYMTPMGRIKHSNETGLRSVNQRRIAKAIRRSIGMGMMPRLEFFRTTTIHAI